ATALLTIRPRRTSLFVGQFTMEPAMEAALIVFSVLVFVAFLIWNRTKDNLERRRLQLQVQEKMLDRIGPGEALTDFLQTDEGKWFVSQLTAEPARSKDTRMQVLTLITLGLIALFGGLF